ncbi:MAG TPA: potassium channel family protein [Falsiroseomonas sp.]|nr:potassium channel family protein [Falsiroseomonas sp.]
MLTLAGCALLILAAYEVYATVLHARARAGPVAEALSRGAWRAALAIAARLPRDQRHRALNRVGPLLLPTLLASLVGLLSLGFALIYLPWMPEGFRVDEGAEDAPPWLQALYFSGVTLTTLGYGDIVPRAMPVRLIALAQSGTGFIAIPLTVAYFLTVNGALERRRAAALALFHEAGRGPDAAAALLARRHMDGRFVGLDEVLSQAAHDLQAVLESHVEHPVTQYFHPIEVHDGLPRMLFLALETGAVLRAFPDPDRYSEACDHPALITLEETAFHAMREVAASLRLHESAPAPVAASPGCGRTHLEGRIERTRSRLAKVGIAQRPNEAAAASAYLEHRSRWEGALRGLASGLGYDWDEVTGDGDPRAAADADRMREDA